MEIQLPELGYAFDALMPYIDEQTMQIHHGKHHAGYIKNLNDALSEFSYLQSKTAEELLSDLSLLPEEVRTTIQNNAGGHVNHSLFWEIIGPNTGGSPADGVRDKIHEKWGSFEAFKGEFNKAALSRFGSGWAWLVVDENKQLQVYSTANQDSPLMQSHVPILGLDVWEHAYYLNYQNRRAEYIEAFWNIVNWQKVNEKLERART